MVKLFKRISKKVGMRPGEVVYVGAERKEPIKIRIIDYTRDELRELEASHIRDCFPFRDSKTVTWINISGIHDVEVIKNIGSHFGIHDLSLEDIANSGQRPKFEEGDGYLMFIIKMKYWPEESPEIVSEQVSILCGENYVISFQEMEGDVFEPVRDRLRRTKPRERFMNADYLAYALMDAVIDNYFAVTERIGEDIEELEDELISKPRTEHLEMIHHLKRELSLMRKATWPLREVVSAMERSESKLIQKETRIYIRDLYEHAIQIIDTVETYRDMVSGLMDIYLSSVSNKMNEVMKVLTIIATIFIPLGFLAGVYGMNFDPALSGNMPELGMPYGYVLFWVVALGIGLGLFVYFKRKKWL
jgi:magnesium transporter